MSFAEPARLKAEALLAERKGKDNFVEYEFKVYKGGEPTYSSCCVLG
jgi:hypothetical protein